MALGINTNRAMLAAQTDFTRHSRDGFVRQERLASGQRINSARDDSARLTVSEGMRAEIRSLSEGNRNTEKAIDLLRTAEGGMNEVSAILVRMRELATQATTDTLNDSNREGLGAEFIQLNAEIDHIARQAAYNGQTLLSGFSNQINQDTSTALTTSATTGIVRTQLSAASTGTFTFADSPGDGNITLSNGIESQTLNLEVLLVGDQLARGTTTTLNFDRLGIQLELAGPQALGATGHYTDGALDGLTLEVEKGVGGAFQLGSDAIPADRLEYDIKDMTSGSPTLNLAGISIATRDGARGALAKIDAAINRSAGERGEVGALINRMGHTLEFSASAIENAQHSESSIRDSDFAAESSALARNQLLRQTNQAVMLQSRFNVEVLMGLLQ
jgi:flagellin